MTEFTLGINTCFAAKRWPEPEEWARLVAEEFGLKTVQFSFDLMDPRAGAGVVGSYIDHTRIACERQGIKIHSTFTGFIPYIQNLLLHPEAPFREDAKAWFKAAIDVTARMGVLLTGGYFGSLRIGETKASSGQVARILSQANGPGEGPHSRARQRKDPYRAIGADLKPLERIGSRPRGWGRPRFLLERPAAHPMSVPVSW